MNKLVITNYEDHILEAVYSDGKLSDLMLFDRQSILSNIYVGKVENIVANIDAAFVDIGTGLPCYYSISDNKHIFLNAKKNSVLKAGDEILVQVSKDAIRDKESGRHIRDRVKDRKSACKYIRQDRYIRKDPKERDKRSSAPTGEESIAGWIWLYLADSMSGTAG